MYCTKCGAENSDTAIYCRKCGELLDHEEETRVVKQDRGRVANLDNGVLEGKAGGDADPYETEAEIFSISPTLMFVKVGYVAAAIAALLFVALVTAVTSVATMWAILVGLLFLLVPAYFHFRQKLVKYTLTESKLEIDEGLFSRTTRNIPIRRIQDVTVNTSISQRMLGFGDLMIDNASEGGGKVYLKNINTPSFYAEVLLRQMRRLEK